MSEWETILPDALHSIRSLLCTATNTTPHERMFNYSRKSTAGKSIPSWVKPGPIFVKNHTRRSKYDAPVSPATLIHANPEYAHVRLASGVETTVSLREVAPFPESPSNTECSGREQSSSLLPTEEEDPPLEASDMAPEAIPRSPLTNNDTNDTGQTTESHRQSTRNRQLPKKFEDYEMG